MSATAPILKASDWFAEMRADDGAAGDEASWLQWIADDGHQKAYESCELAWELSAELRDSPALAAALANADALINQRAARKAPKARAKWRVSLWQIGLAAGIVALGAFAWLMVSRPVTAEYTTGIGEERSVSLADGSAILLNTNSAVHVELSKHLRRIDLSRGEALFTVSHDPGRPFAVHALQGVTTAVGTQFDVEIHGSTAIVEVLEGTVTVGRSGAPAPIAVSAGKSVGYDQEGTVSELRPAEISRIQGWRSQRVVFEDIPLSAALSEYNRYTQTPIVLGDPALGSQHINGVFHIGDEAAFLSALDQGLHLKATKGDTQTVLEAQTGGTP